MQAELINRFIIHPNSRFKISWDLIIIMFSVYNSMLIPYEFAYGRGYSWVIDQIDTLVDICFIIDIIINFRTAYFNSKTGKLVTESKKIAYNYILYGRFGIDLIASLPVDFLTTVSSASKTSLKSLGMLKMVRLLRLGRMISFLKANQKLKFSIKIGQLLFFVFLIIHWVCCLWYYVTAQNEEWFPPKDLDIKYTEAYTGASFDKYIMFYYYGALTLVANDLLPATEKQTLIAVALYYLGMIIIGMVIGEFTSLLSSITK